VIIQMVCQLRCADPAFAEHIITVLNHSLGFAKKIWTIFYFAEGFFSIDSFDEFFCMVEIELFTMPELGSLSG